MPIDFENVAAFAPMGEPVVWRQDAEPHRTGTFSAVVTRGAVDSASAGPALSPFVADVWTVHAPTACALAAGVAVGDSIRRMVGDVLTVQSIVRDEGGFWLHCTAAERSPV